MLASRHHFAANAAALSSSSWSRTGSVRRPWKQSSQQLFLLRGRLPIAPPSRPRPSLRQTVTTAASAAALASTTFSAATVAAVCAYAALITRPRSRLAHFLTSSPLLPLTGCLAYLLGAFCFWPGAVSRAASAAVAASSPLPSVGAFASLFASSPGATALTWLHLLAGDFSAAAWVVRDARRLGGDEASSPSALFALSDDDDDDDGEEGDKGEEKKKKSAKFSFLQLKKRRHFPCAVSVILCFMAGPLGILAHLLTRRLWYKMGWGTEIGQQEQVEKEVTAVTPAALSTF